MSEELSPPWMREIFVVGSHVAGYRLEEQIGRGGMAVVFRAHDERLNRLVALKIMAPALAADVAFRQRFVRESRAAASVDDPNIIPVFEAGEAEGVLFIAMRLVRGGDVRSLMASHGPLAPSRVAWIVSAAASALDAAHAEGLVHRDVKPANMLLDERPGRPDHVYLSDFGLSKGTLGSTGLTSTGQFLGTVDYAAPEQIQGGRVDGRTDQYALGCSTFELLSGRPPYQRDQGLAAVYAHLSEPPPSLTALRPGLPLAVDAVIERVLAKSPADRYPTCGEFADALASALGIQQFAGVGEGIGDRQPTDVVSLVLAPEAAGDRGSRADTTGMAVRSETSVPGGEGPVPGAESVPGGDGPVPGAESVPGGPPAGVVSVSDPTVVRTPTPGPESAPPASDSLPAGSVPVADLPLADGQDDRRSRRILVVSAAAALLIAAVAGILLARPGGAPSPASAMLTSAAERNDGLLIVRRWTLNGHDGSLLAEAIAVRNSSGQALRATLTQPVPASLAGSLAAARFSSPGGQVVDGGTAVQWTVQVAAHATARVSYRVTVPASGLSNARLSRLVRDFRPVTAQVVVPPSPTAVMSLRITPAVVHLYPGRSARLKLAGVLYDGQAAPSSALSDVAWKTSNRSVARVSAAGKVIAVSPGRARVSAQAGRARATAVVVVAPPIQPSPTTSYAQPAPQPTTSSQPTGGPSTVTPTSTLAEPRSPTSSPAVAVRLLRMSCPAPAPAPQAAMHSSPTRPGLLRALLARLARHVGSLVSDPCPAAPGAARLR